MKIILIKFLGKFSKKLMVEDDPDEEDNIVLEFDLKYLRPKKYRKI